jgi:hypothetical protein
MLMVLMLFAFSSATIGIIVYRIKPRWEMLAIVIYSFMSLLTSLLVVLDPFHARGLPVNIFTFFEYYLFSFLIAKTVGFKFIRSPLIVTSTLFTAFLTRYIMRFRLDQMHAELIILENIFLTILALYYYKKLVFTDRIIDFKSDFMFWVITGAIMYFCLSTPYFVFVYGLTFKNMQILFLVNTVLNAFMHCFFIIGFLWQIKGFSLS